MNRNLARAKANPIESDLAYERFDPTLAKYKPQSLTTITPITPITPIASATTPKSSLADLWSKYIEFKRTQVSQSTVAKDYKKVESHIQKLPTKFLDDAIEIRDYDDAIEIRDYLVKNLTPNAAKRCLTQFSACCNWAIKSALISNNPFQGMAAEIKTPKSKASEHDINPFTIEERDRIVSAFEANRYYSYYAPLVKFLFLTGCRPSEAIALQWKHISSDFHFISFEQAVTISENGLALKEGLKTQERRKFPCNSRLQALLQSIQPEILYPDELIFPSPEKKYIDFHNFRNRAWKRILQSLNIEYRKPYQTRHTFITLAIENGLDAKDIGQLVGNSPEIIYRHYAGYKRELIVPEF
ncbi:MAG: Tyrosine recombinase XerC [Chroococcidiopsis sp. SAG 2025]|uniref:site-specific integrase n=1 Tax=Chroococcidiopsis sp. SAG 2025 TaxID=171389 RepID=UPI0029370170|nr:site-specific integrase [Chroococcidiopsis sp. SAG 2025]MDV2992472.1 Tyrosine recombinase XerC [Chroococcidiopsis sp. SAG 2025]